MSAAARVSRAPSFKFATPEPVRRGLDGWTRGNTANREHWWPFYFGPGGATVSNRPSPFASWVHEREPAPVRVVDIGSGTGRDSLWFARQGRDVLGLDYIPAATERAASTAAAEGLPAPCWRWVPSSPTYNRESRPQT